MRDLIRIETENCVGCNRCARACPIETANYTYLTADGELKVKVNKQACIACGACIPVCAHGARSYQDDLEAFFAALEAGEQISLLAAPSLKTNAPQWGRLLTWLRQKGVAKIYDISLGADICIWAHLRYMEKNMPVRMIAQPCPAIVSYCEIHRPQLLGHLSPVHSPMACAAILLRNREGTQGQLAALTPCIAKGNECEDTGLVGYNITFSRLLQYIEENQIELPAEESSFDHGDAGLGSLFPTPGGLRENLEYFFGKTIRIDKSEGPEVYRDLNTYAESPWEILPNVFDVLNCEEGCNIGPAATEGHNLFEMQMIMNEQRQSTLNLWSSGQGEEMYANFDKNLNLEDFLRSYSPKPAGTPEVTEDAIQRAFLQMDKDSFAKQNFNCGACGSDTCRAMARKIALNINIPINCVIKARDDALRERARNEKLYRRNAEYIELVQQIGEDLLSAGDIGSDKAITSALSFIGTTFHSSISSLWRVNKRGGEYVCERIYHWPEDKDNTSMILKPWPVSWLHRLEKGHHINVSPDEMVGLFQPHVQQLRAVPILIHGNFWGLIALTNEDRYTFDDEEISVISAAGILIVSSILEREMTETLIRTREEALAGTRSKSEFLSRMSHEMRTPMNAIIGMAKVAAGTDDAGRVRHCLGTIESSGSHLLGLINDVLDMSKIEAGKLELDAFPFNLAETLQKAGALTAQRAAQKGQALRFIVEQGTPAYFEGDEMRLTQVILNLLSNAVKFTPDEGAVTLTVSEEARNRQGSMLRFVVRDTGIGLNDEQISRLFNAFEQANAGISTRFGGTGLGLAISKNIVEKMGGRIWVDSVPGEGSAFSFEVFLGADVLERSITFDRVDWDVIHEELACPIPSGAPDATTLPADALDLSGLRVLLVEDIDVNREIFIALLEQPGLEIDTAENGEEAVQMFEADPNRYDLIFMDIQMPVMNGYEATKRIRAMDVPRARSIPILAMTANAFQDDITRCLEAGMNDHLSKPIDEVAITEKLARYTGRS